MGTLKWGLKDDIDDIAASKRASFFSQKRSKRSKFSRFFEKEDFLDRFFEKDDDESKVFSR